MTTKPKQKKIIKAWAICNNGGIEICRCHNGTPALFIYEKKKDAKKACGISPSKVVPCTITVQE